MNTFTRLVLAGLAFTITACSSGGGEPTQQPTSPSPPPPPPPTTTPGREYVACADQAVAAEPSLAVPTVSPGGIWGGTLTNDTKKTTGSFDGMIGEDGRFHISAYDWGAERAMLQFAGRVDVVGNTFAGTGNAYMDAGTTSVETNYSGEVEITGVVVERDSFTAHWTSATGDTGCIDATTYFAHEYEQPLPGGVPALTWTSFQTPGMVLTTDADGNFSGQSSDGCTVIGRTGSIDDRYGLYAAVLEISGCGSAGDYAGVVYVCQTCGMAPIDRSLLLFVDNGVRAIRRFLVH